MRPRARDALVEAMIGLAMILAIIFAGVAAMALTGCRAAAAPIDPWEPPTVEDRAIVERAYLCRRAPAQADPWLLLYILRMEDLEAPPPAPTLRGWSLAQACRESGYDPRAQGDAGRAVGLVQWWPWAERYIDRRDAVSSVWLLHRRVRCQLTGEGDCRPLWRDCRPRDWREAWVVAWVRAIRSRGTRCGEEPLALAWLRRWRGEGG